MWGDVLLAASDSIEESVLVMVPVRSATMPLHELAHRQGRSWRGFVFGLELGLWFGLGLGTWLGLGLGLGFEIEIETPAVCRLQSLRRCSPIREGPIGT